MKKKIKSILIIIGIFLIAIQFIRPEKNNGGYDQIANFKKDTKPSEEVFSILKKQCFDCHSNQTKYPWYAEISPISLWLDDHIVQGKKKFNMSKWNAYSLKKKDHKLEELIEEVEKGEMPLNSFTWIHGELSENDKNLLLKWAALARLQYQDELKISSK